MTWVHDTLPDTYVFVCTRHLTLFYVLVNCMPAWYWITLCDTYYLCWKVYYHCAFILWFLHVLKLSVMCESIFALRMHVTIMSPYLWDRGVTTAFPHRTPTKHARARTSWHMHLLEGCIWSLKWKLKNTCFLLPLGKCSCSVSSLQHICRLFIVGTLILMITIVMQMHLSSISKVNDEF